MLLVQDSHAALPTNQCRGPLDCHVGATKAVRHQRLNAFTILKPGARSQEQHNSPPHLLCACCHHHHQLLLLCCCPSATLQPGAQTSLVAHGEAAAGFSQHPLLLLSAPVRLQLR